MIITTIKCDYCWCQLQQNQYSTLAIYKNYAPKNRTDLQLCPECLDEFLAWHSDRWPGKVKR